MSSTPRLPQAKTDSMFNPTFKAKVSKRFQLTYNFIKPFDSNNSFNKRHGIPIKQNTGSMDRINKLKAQNMVKT